MVVHVFAEGRLEVRKVWGNRVEHLDFVTPETLDLWANTLEEIADDSDAIEYRVRPLPPDMRTPQTPSRDKSPAMLMRSPLARDRRQPPGFIRPCQPVLSAKVPTGDGFQELKHDGFRIVG